VEYNPFSEHNKLFSSNFKRRIREDYGTKRVLNFDSVVNEQNELINIKK
jgi:hypothetical protein